MMGRLAGRRVTIDLHCVKKAGPAACRLLYPDVSRVSISVVSRWERFSPLLDVFIDKAPII